MLHPHIRRTCQEGDFRVQHCQRPLHPVRLYAKKQGAALPGSTKTGCSYKGKTSGLREPRQFFTEKGMDFSTWDLQPGKDCQATASLQISLDDLYSNVGG